MANFKLVLMDSNPLQSNPQVQLDNSWEFQNLKISKQCEEFELSIVFRLCCHLRNLNTSSSYLQTRFGLAKLKTILMCHNAHRRCCPQIMSVIRTPNVFTQWTAARQVVNFIFYKKLVCLPQYESGQCTWSMTLFMAKCFNWEILNWRFEFQSWPTTSYRHTTTNTRRRIARTILNGRENCIETVLNFHIGTFWITPIVTQKFFENCSG